MFLEPLNNEDHSDSGKSHKRIGGDREGGRVVRSGFGTPILLHSKLFPYFISRGAIPLSLLIVDILKFEKDCDKYTI